MSTTKGGFTLPGEAGYEKLTLEMAEKWGADVIRDSDGTVLSDTASILPSASSVTIMTVQNRPWTICRRLF